MMMDIKEIMTKLPHRYPFLLVDRVLEMDSESITAIKNVTMNEPFFQGHFPSYPVMPGVLIIEAMAQVAGIHTISTAEVVPENAIFFFMGVDGVKFRKQVVPGDQLVMKIKVIKKKKDLVRVKAEAFVDDQLACEGELTAIMRGA
ncbi:MAG: 3-hydroxyacyl-ACP dehydratase FabZ [Seleniivibrio sp.]|nr:3-hydroxyacyl-ACP dehydratase FabZ [Seleniivibrio sp.]MCD8555025.1 3-hydroxyacyl-ACP dehydratase FabZ [Seleniivibrio sp.]